MYLTQQITIIHLTICNYEEAAYDVNLTGFTYVANAQYRGSDDGYRNQDNERVRHETNRDRGNDNVYRTSGGKQAQINSYQRNARVYIAQGIIDGTITSREAAGLLEMSERIEQKENRYVRRGELSRREAAELQNDLKELNRRILKERKDWDRQGIDESRIKKFN